MKIPAFKIGASLYMLWGLQHVAFGGAFLNALANGGVPSVLKLSETATTIPEKDFPSLLNGMLAWHSFNIISIGFLAIAAGVAMFRKKSDLGYLTNLIAVGVFEVGFIVMILIPGYIKPSGAIMGPVLFVLAAILSTVGRRQRAGTPSA